MIAGCSCPKADKAEAWKGYDTGTVYFEDKAEGTAGSSIYHSIIADPESYIQEQAREVLSKKEIKGRRQRNGIFESKTSGGIHAQAKKQ